MIIEKITKKSSITSDRLQWLKNHASFLYKVYEIDKRGPGNQKRQICQPTKELKIIQRWLIKRFISRLPVSEAATGYKLGASIRNNATAHKHTRFTVRIDFKEFFPSFQQLGIEKFLRENAEILEGFDEEDISFCSSLFTRHGSITIGAPSSPALTNAMMYGFDKSLTLYCSERELIYTRYADDIFISSNRSGRLQDAVEFTRVCIKKFRYADLKLNEEKTAYLTRKYRRSITGLIITPDEKVSLGRARKREIKSLTFDLVNETLDESAISRLRGLVAFSLDVEPTFVNALRLKYSSQVIDKLLMREV